MDNRNLFHFPFVNHFTEKDKISSFLETESNHVLWLSGEHGIGKTFLIEQIEKMNSDYKQIYLSIKSTDIHPCLFRFLLLLENNAVTTFKQFIGRNYEHLLSTGQSIVLQVLKNKGLDISDLVNAAFEGTKVFINTEKKEQSAQKVIINYIKTMAENHKLLIVFDDFSLCDEKSTNYIIEIILQLLDDLNIKFIISTTPEELNRRQNIQIMLMEKLPLVPLYVNNFKDEIYFHEILNGIFALNENDKPIVSELFIKYQGKPNQLKKFIRDLYCKDGIIFSKKNEKAKWKKDVVNQVLEDGGYKNSFTTIEKLILKIILAFNQTLPYKLLYDAVLYLVEIIFHSQDLLKNSIQQSLLKLLDTDILHLGTKGEVTILQSDIIKKLQKEIWNSAISPLFSNQIYNFLQNNKSELTNNISLEEWDFLCVHHSYIAQISGWEKLNYKYATMLFQKGRYEEASIIFKRIPLSSMPYELNDYMMIINCYFEAGNYTAAKQIMSLTTIPSTASSMQKIEYHMTCSKVFNIILEKDNAITELEEILPLVKSGGNIYLEVLNRKQEILVDTLNGREKAKIIFDQFVSFYNSGMQNLVIGKALKNSIDFYHADMALDYIDKAEKIFINNNSTLELGFLHTNRGFEHFRQNDIIAAYKDFQMSIDCLKDIRFYEISYPLNNMAACHMYNGNYEKAISYIFQARLHNKSNYVEVVLKTQLMICYYMQEKYIDALEISKELEKHIHQSQIADPTMLRKIYINIATLYSRYGDEKKAYQYVSKIYTHTKGTSTWYRAYLIMSREDSTIQNPLVHCIKTEVAYWSKTPFEPWLVTFSHE